MGEVFFCETEDGSIGLFNKKVDDIYHSTHGAYSESYEKFLVSSGFLDFIKQNDKVSILDVCYGIGYNSKVAIDEILKLDKPFEIKIDALEYDKNLINISPFLKNQLVNDKINDFLIKQSNFNEKFSVINTIKIFTNLNGLKYINWKKIARIGLEKMFGKCDCKVLFNLGLFLHNIYYNYISRRNKNESKGNIFTKMRLSFYCEDARATVQELKEQYNFIFHDGFTPKKLPTLWSLEFFQELYRLLDDDGVLVTYSSSAAIRAAMIEAGFYIGCSLDKNNKRIGTIAVKNKSLIKNELSEFDLKLIKTKAGIFYRDRNLNATVEQINALRNKEIENSNRITSSRLKKDYGKLQKEL